MRNAIVILNYNDYKTTIDYINKIKKYKILDLIVIVDNASTDNSYNELLKYENDKIKVLKADENKGYNAGNNIGCKYVVELNKYTNIIISNPDIEVNEDTIEEMIYIANNNDDIAVVAPYIMQDNEIHRGYKIPSPLVESLLNLPFVYRLAKNKVKDKNIRFYPEKHYKKKFSCVDCVLGCFFLIKCGIINSNYFDENVFLYGEEDILGKVIKNLNKKIVVVNDLMAIHNHSVSINKSFNETKKIKISNKSKMYFHKKYNNANIFELGILYLTGKIKLLNTYIKESGGKNERNYTSRG